MKRSLLIACILIFGLFVCGCTYFNSSTSKDMLPQDKYVAIRVDSTNTSTLIGTPPYTPVQPMPIPTPVPYFDYDNSKGWLGPELAPYGISSNDSLKVIVGNIRYWDTPTMSGYMGIDLRGIYALPFTFENGLTILNITGNGTVLAEYENKSIYLKPGENWTMVKTADNTTGAYLANMQNNNTFDYQNVTQMPWPVKSEQNYTFTNEGLLDKTRIR